MILKNNINSSLPIGIIDSGIGGLSVVKYIKNIIPNEQIIYFGDTKNMPYGNKHKKIIQYYSLNIIEFLIKKKCKAIIIACNSIASNALEAIKKKIPKNIILLDVISPIIKNYSFINFKKLGIIATKATIKSNIFFNNIKKRNLNLKIIQISAPLLASIIENGSSERIINKYINYYLGNKKLKKIDSLILACTHYNIIKKQIYNYYNNKIKLIDSTKIISKQIYEKLKELNLLSKKVQKKDIFYVSKLTNNFIKTINIFFGEKKIIPINIFNYK